MLGQMYAQMYRSRQEPSMPLGVVEQMLGMVTKTSDSLVRSALFPGVPQEVFEQVSAPEAVVQETEAMYETEGDAKEPDWMADDGPLWREPDGEG